MHTNANCQVLNHQCVNYNAQAPALQASNQPDRDPCKSTQQARSARETKEIAHSDSRQPDTKP